MIPFKFWKHLGHQQTTVPGLWCDLVGMILGLPFWYNTGVWQHIQIHTQ